MILLIVEDDPTLRKTLTTLFEEKFRIFACDNGSEALRTLERQSVDIVISDHQMPGLTGLEVIRRGRALSPSTSFILMTAYGSVDQAVEALRAGADDYLLKPFELEEIEHRVKRVEELRAWALEQKGRSAACAGVDRLIGGSAAIRNTREFIKKVAKASAPVLLLGPTGSGKEVVAQAIHESGPRAERNFVAINCASLSEQLIESELFGHEKGAFTGAVSAKQGKFEFAAGGTLFLDEVGELTPPLQAKLLRVLQEKEFTRVGGLRVIQSDARVIAATHRPLKEMVATGAFREDLFFRLNVLAFELAPLRERKEDVPVLIDHFAALLGRELGRRILLAPETRQRLLAYSYPGNIRELRNVLERLAVLAPEQGEVGSDLLPPEFAGPIGASPSSSGPAAVPLGGQGLIEILEAQERRILQEALAQAGNSRAKAATLLKIPRGTLLYKLKKYGLGGEDGETGQEEAA